MSRSPLSVVVVALALSACAPARPATSPVDRSSGSVAAPTAEPGAPASRFPTAPATVPAPPPECAAFAEHATEPQPSCDRAAGLGALDAALAVDAPAERDARLAAVEGCAAFPPGAIRALRMELGPTACGDVLAERFFAAEPASVRADVEQAIVGLGLAARLTRLVRNAPHLDPPFDKPKFLDFFEHELKPWVVVQARTIYDISAAGSRLTGYGRAVAAVEAGLSDMRFVEVTRAVPLPDEMSRDSEVRDQYYMMLDQALEARKTRGRDAALAGLKGLEQEGVLVSPRVAEARRLLSELYGGRRIDALDHLLVPQVPKFEPGSLSERLATKLPTYYAGLMLAAEDPHEPRLLRALITQGLPSGVRANLGSSTLAPEVRALWSRALFELGRAYWSAEDFRAAHRSAQELVDPPGAPPDADTLRLIAALSGVLEGGPADAAQMMLRGPFIPSDVGNTSAVDRLASGRGAAASLAAFDSAYLRSLVPPVEPSADYWHKLAQDYQRAAKSLTDAGARRDANERAKAAEDTAKALTGTSRAH